MVFGTTLILAACYAEPQSPVLEAAELMIGGIFPGTAEAD
jgi:hypothetical protein